MGFSLSPAVIVNEKDFTSIVPAVSTSAGAFAGVFSWGPVMDPVTVTSEDVLVQRFGKPNNENFESFYTAANYLAYSNNITICRVATSGSKNACEIPGSTASLNIDNVQDYLDNVPSSTYGQFAAKFPGTYGNSIRISYADYSTFSTWAYASLFSSAPGTSDASGALGGANDELHVVIIDEKGIFSGEVGSVLEKYEFLSKSKDSKRSDGTNSYYVSVLNSDSKYVWWMAFPSTGTNWGAGLNTVFSAATAYNSALTGAVDDFIATTGESQAAWALFANDELYDVALLPLGKADPTLAQYVIQNVCEIRKDCIALVSPHDHVGGGPIVGYGSDAVNKTKLYRSALVISSSYGFMDSGYKYQYDRYNDVYRYVPLNGDTAGIFARSEYTTDAWFSPAGLNRGQYKNITKLAFNPGKTERDALYQAGINPVVNFPGQGVVLFGDRTLLTKPSAFREVGIRRLFIVLEKAISTAAKYQLFEFNDAFTRAQFKNLVEPFLRDVQGRRGLQSFKVVADERNNTGEVIDRQEFVGDIYLKPNHSINTIYLNFIATRTSVSFEEVGAG